MSKRTELLSDLARQALAQYDADIKAGGEPIYPLWAKELRDVLASYGKLVAALCIITNDLAVQIEDAGKNPAADSRIKAARAALATAEAA